MCVQDLHSRGQIQNDLAWGSLVPLSKNIACGFVLQKAKSNKRCLVLAMACGNVCSSLLNVEEFTATDPASSISLPLQLVGLCCARQVEYLQNKDQHNYMV